MSSGGRKAGGPKLTAIIMGLAIATVMTVSFQNCDGGFHYDPTSTSLSSINNNSGVGSSQFKITTFTKDGLAVPEGQSFDGGVEYKILASGSALSTAVITWSMPQNTGNCVLRSATGPEARFVTCDKSGRVTIQASAVFEDGATSVLASERTTGELIRDLCGSSTFSRVVFRLPVGTGAGAWNAVASPVVVYVGQTLRICNDDTTNHQLHTDGSPCTTQGAPMAKGAFYDCSIASVSLATGPGGTYTGLYDQIVGMSAPFYVKPYDGRALYADTTKTNNGQSCVSCHNPFATSSKRGAQFSSIKNAILTNRGGMANYTNITDDELKAIAFSLNQ